MESHSPSRYRAKHAAFKLGYELGWKALWDGRGDLVIDEPAPVETALILGTGWGDVLEFDEKTMRSLPFIKLPGFETLDDLEGHKRQVIYGQIGGKPVLALSGRVHLNEAPADPKIPDMVRLQVEMLLQLGVKNLVVTSAVGSLISSVTGVMAGDVVLIDGFVSLYAPPMPLYAGEFVSPDDVISTDLIKTAAKVCPDGLRQRLHTCGHVMVRGPFFEGRRYDKQLLAQSGAQVVGMSILPEACVVALYPGTRLLPLSFVTNDEKGVHSHDSNQEAARKEAALLGSWLTNIVAAI